LALPPPIGPLNLPVAKGVGQHVDDARTRKGKEGMGWDGGAWQGCGHVHHTRTFGDDERLELSLLGCTLHDLALDRVPADQPEYEHGLRLSDAVCPILRLKVHLWILAKIKER
jgi:hypothetical protein